LSYRLEVAKPSTTGSFYQISLYCLINGISEERLESNLYWILDFVGINASLKGRCSENILILSSFRYIEIIIPLYLELISLIVFKSSLGALNVLLLSAILSLGLKYVINPNSVRLTY